LKSNLKCFYLIIIAFLCPDFGLRASERQADATTSKSLSINAALYDSLPVARPIDEPFAAEFSLPFSFLPKRDDDVMGKGAQKSPRVFFNPQLGLRTRLSGTDNLSYAGRVWGGYVDLNKVPLGKLKKIHVTHRLYGASLQVQYVPRQNWQFFMPLVYQSVFGQIEGNIIAEQLNTRSRFSVNQFGVGMGANQTNAPFWFSLMRYQRSAKARFRFHDSSEELVSLQLEDFKISWQMTMGYRYSKNMDFFYSQSYIPRRLLVPQVGFTYLWM